MSMRGWAAGTAAFCVACCCGPARAADPAVARIEAFYAQLETTMKAGKVTPARLAPLVEQTFNIPVMAQFAVGAPWASMSAADRAAITGALVRYTAARYAHDFSTFTGQAFVVDQAAQSRGPDRLVKSEVRERGEAPTKLYYRLRDYPGGWRAIDVYYKGVSEIATQRADFTGSLAKGGAPLLVKKLEEATAKLN